MSHEMNRRELLRRSAGGLAAIGLSSLTLRAGAQPTANSGTIGAYGDYLRSKGENADAIPTPKAALTSEPKAPRDFVAGVFGECAGSFDTHLVDVLKYRAPQHVVEALKAAGATSGLDVLDLGGCTGLIGALVRPMARTLIGVDLAPQMLAIARKRGTYDELVEAEIVAFMHDTERRFDLVTAGDVLVYIGELAGVFAQIARVLHAGGLFAFSVEAQEDAGYQLRPSRRYTHSIAYVRSVTAAKGLTDGGSWFFAKRRPENSAGVDPEVNVRNSLL